MTTPSEQQPREAGFFRAIRDWGITRGDNGFLGGVVDGMAQRVGMATVPARIVVVIAALILNGLLLLTYAAAWALLPDRRGNIIVQNFGRGMPNVGALIGIALFTLFGMSDLNPVRPFRSDSFPFNSGNFPFFDSTLWSIFGVVIGVLIPLAFVGAVVWFIITMVRRSQDSVPGQPAAAPSPRPGTTADAPAASATPADAPAPEPAPAAGQATATAPMYAAMPTASTSSTPTQASTGHPMYYPPVPPAPPAPPVQPRVPGPGRGFYLTALAWIALSGAMVGLMDRRDQLAVHPAAAWFVVMVTGLGVLLMAVSLAGRKLGFLGFMVIVLALPLPIIAAGANELRDTYANDGSLLRIDIDGVTQQLDGYDATTDFADEYTEVAINGDCRQEATVPASPTSTTRLSFESLEADTSVDVVSQLTYVTLPKGTDLSIVGNGDAQAHVIWPDRDITCDFWDAGGQHLSLADNVGPAVTLVVYDDAYSNTIVITEVQS